jgi:hypothetical protein
MIGDVPRLTALAAGIAVAVAALAVTAPAPAVAETTMIEIGGVVMTPQPVIGYRRGRKTSILVVPIDWGEIEVRTARAFIAMRDAAAADGVQLWVNSGYRSQEHQQWLYTAWRAGFGNRAARPGYSNHQSGRALDLDLDRPGALDWLSANARRFGFKRTVKSEPWHWEWNGKRAKAKSKVKVKAKPRARSRARSSRTSGRRR